MSFPLKVLININSEKLGFGYLFITLFSKSAEELVFLLTKIFHVKEKHYLVFSNNGLLVFS